jgi:hypothetical protein
LVQVELAELVAMLP